MGSEWGGKDLGTVSPTPTKWCMNASSNRSKAFPGFTESLGKT